MKTIACLLFGALVLAENAAADADTSSLILNGDFESKEGWTINPRDGSNQGSNSAELIKGAQSPFSKGTQGLHLFEGAGSSQPPLVIQDLAQPTDAPVKMSFDFKVNSQTTYTGGDGVLTMILYTMPGYGGPRFSLMICGSGTIKLTGKTATEVGSYSLGVWNHMTVVFPGSAGGNVPITLTPFGGSPVTFSGSFEPFDATASKYRFLQIQPGFGDYPVTDVYVDNVTIEPGATPQSSKAPASKP